MIQPQPSGVWMAPGGELSQLPSSCKLVKESSLRATKEVLKWSWDSTRPTTVSGNEVKGPQGKKKKKKALNQWGSTSCVRDLVLCQADRKISTVDLLKNLLSGSQRKRVASAPSLPKVSLTRSRRQHWPTPICCVSCAPLTWSKCICNRSRR